MTTRTDLPAMQLIDIGGVELEVHDTGGHGQPLVLAHSPVREEWLPLLAEPALADHHRIIHFHRRGYGESSNAGLPLDLRGHAADCHALMRRLGIERAHLAGLSLGGSILLQFAVDFPEAVASLALLEPALPEAVEHPEYQQLLADTAPLFEAGDVAKGFDVLMQGLGGADYATHYDRTLPPGWFDRVLEDQDVISQDVEALHAWEFTGQDAGMISAPVLNLKASASTPYHQDGFRTLQAWIPHAEPVVVEDSAHALLTTKPREIAEHLARFVAAHPIR